MRPVSRTSVSCGVAALLAVLVYANALHNPFVYDDYHTVAANTSIERLADVRAIVLHDVTRPLVNFSYALDRFVWGDQPVGFHVTNLLLHALNVILLFQLALRLVGGASGPAAAFAAAGLLAVHPMMTEAVGYISGRSEVLCTTWMLGGLLCGLRWMKGGGGRWAAATAAFWVASLASKETAAMFPLALLACDWLAIDAPAADKRRRSRRLYLPMTAIAVAGGLARIAILRFEYGSQVAVHPDYMLLELDVFRRYLGLLVRPSNQTVFHAVPPVPVLSLHAAAAAAALALLVWLAWTARTRLGAASFGIVWFLLMLVPSAALAVLDQGEPMAEHRVYIASSGFFLAAGAGIGALGVRLARERGWWLWAGRAALALVLASFMAQTVLRNDVWASPVGLWQESVDLAPEHFRPRLLLGEALEDAGRREEAVAEYRTAMRLRPDDATGYLKLGLALVELGQISEAKTTLRRALDVDPGNEPARRALSFLAGVETAR